MNQWRIHWQHDGVIGIIQPQVGTYEADPFLFNGWLFYELYDYKKGVIAARPFPDGEPLIVMEKSHHLSFPCVWEENGKVFMMPETGAGDLVIYECEQFPDKWVEVYRRGGNYGDSIYYRGFIFTTEGSDHYLRIFKDGNLLLSEERMNSRCAGHIFEQDGKLIRPTQVGDTGYGMGVILKELELDGFKEREIKRIVPTGLETGLHTYNKEGNVLVWDTRITL